MGPAGRSGPGGIPGSLAVCGVRPQPASQGRPLVACHSAVTPWNTVLPGVWLYLEASHKGRTFSGDAGQCSACADPVCPSGFAGSVLLFPALLPSPTLGFNPRLFTRPFGCQAFCQFWGCRGICLPRVCLGTSRRVAVKECPGQDRGGRSQGS